MASSGSQVPAKGHKLTDISARAFQHPADRAATAALGSIPYLDTVVRKLVEWGLERAMRQFYLGNSVKIGENQLPETWTAHTAMARILDVPDVPDLYLPLVKHKRVTRVVALSGGYTRAEACRRLAANHGVIASFSRALVEELRHSMSDAEFEAALAKAIDEIYQASTVKV